MKIDTAQQHEQIAIQILRHIIQNRGKVSLSGVTGLVGASERLCQQAFIEFTGEGIDDYCRRLRLELAAELLSRGDDPVWQVALETGYSSVPGFDHAFRSHYDCTPSTFRELNPAGVTFPSYAYDQGFEPGQERVEIGVYTGFAQITTFTYDLIGLTERQTPDGMRHTRGASRRGNAICHAILGERKGNT